jgi:hypothetical protein
LRDRFRFEPRGTINVKGPGTMRTYCLARPEAAPSTRA